MSFIKIKAIRKLIAALIVVFPTSIFAADLLEVYKIACENDPTLKAARAEFMANKQNLPISVANFLPQIFGHGSLQRNRLDNQTPGIPYDVNGVYYYNASQYSLSARQAVFNFANWAQLSGAGAVVKQYAAKLSASTQDLMIRTTSAYFNVLVASEDLRFIRAEKTAIHRELEQNEARFKVGLISVTSVEESKASYDASVAREIAAKNRLDDKIEELREITDKTFDSLNGIGKDLPLVKPVPADIDQWTSLAVKQNYTLQSAHYATLAAKATITQQFSGHLPVVNAGADYNYSYQDNPFGTQLGSRVKSADIFVSADLPIFSGGSTSALTKQARYYYLQASANEVKVHRSIVGSARKSYLGVMSGISQIKADRQAIISSKSAFDATEAAYKVGTRTFVDVLDAQSKIYNIERIRARDEYDYLLNTLLLKQAAGTLSIEDLEQVNRILSQRVEFSVQ